MPHRLDPDAQTVLFLSPAVSTRHTLARNPLDQHRSPLFTVGGLNADASPVSTISLLDLHTMTWSQRKCSPPVNRINHVAGYACGSLYLYGGSDGTSSVSGHELIKLRCSDFPQQSAVSARIGLSHPEQP